MLLFHRALLPGSFCPTRLHFPIILEFRGTTVMKFWPLGCQVKSCISLPSLVIGTAYMTVFQIWAYLPILPAGCHGDILSLLPGWLGGTKISESHYITVSYMTAISVTLAAKSSGPQQPDQVWPRQPESYQAVARTATRQKWGVRTRRQRGSTVQFKTAQQSGFSMKFLDTLFEIAGWIFGFHMQMPGERNEGKSCPLKEKAYFHKVEHSLLVSNLRETLTRLAWRCWVFQFCQSRAWVRS